MIGQRTTDPWRIQRQVAEIEKATYKGGLERKLKDFAVWYYKNQPRIPDGDVHKRLAFVEKSLEIAVEVLAEAVIRIQHAESHPKHSLLLPASYQ